MTQLVIILLLCFFAALIGWYVWTRKDRTIIALPRVDPRKLSDDELLESLRDN